MRVSRQAGLAESLETWVPFYSKTTLRYNLFLEPNIPTVPDMDCAQPQMEFLMV
jgi:hypothetical protein